MANGKGKKVSRRDRIAGGGFNPAQTTTLMEDMVRSEALYVESNTVDVSSPSATDAITIIATPDLFTTPDMGGNPQTSPNVDNWSRRNFVVQDVTDAESRMDIMRAYCPMTDGETGDPASLPLWCNLGAEVTGYTAYYEINDPNALCPFDGGTSTWQEWERNGASGEPVEIPVGGGLWYRSNQRFSSDRGEPQNASEWYAYIETPDTANTSIVRVISVEDYLQIQADNAEPEPEPVNNRRGRR